jgi:hypothetical protein
MQRRYQHVGLPFELGPTRLFHASDLGHLALRLALRLADFTARPWQAEALASLAGVRAEGYSKAPVVRESRGGTVGPAR